MTAAKLPWVDWSALDEPVPKRAKNTLVLWRAAEHFYLSQGASFAETKKTAKLYLENPGFGGDKLWRVVVSNRKTVDLRSMSTEKVANRFGLDDPGAIGVDEWLPRGRVADAIAKRGFVWALVDESYPEGTTTHILVTSDENIIAEIEDAMTEVSK